MARINILTKRTAEGSVEAKPFAKSKAEEVARRESSWDWSLRLIDVVSRNEDISEGSECLYLSKLWIILPSWLLNESIAAGRAETRFFAWEYN